MITVISTYQLPKPIMRDEARRMFLSTAPKYQGVPGLVRKYYVPVARRELGRRNLSLELPS